MATIIEQSTVYFYRVIISLVILIAGLALAVLTKKILLSILQGVKLNHWDNIAGDLERGISSFASALVVLATIYFSVKQLGIPSWILYLGLVIIVLMIVFISLVGAKDVPLNLIAGLKVRQKLKMRQELNISGICGKIEKIQPLNIILKTKAGDQLYIANTLLQTNIN